MILKCFENGADGVMVLGCHPGDCHYLTGNEEAQRRIESTKELLGLLGIDSRRLLLEWISASEGDRFARTVDEFVFNVSGLGPLRGDARDG